jgi:hypothetical protein
MYEVYSFVLYKLTELQMLLAVDSLYVVTIALFKISLGVFFLRVLIHPYQRTVIHWILYIFTTFSVGYLFFAVFQCGIPRGSDFWERRISNHCSPVALNLVLGYMHAVLSAASDLILMCLPIPALRNSTLKLREKIVVGGILTFGTT